MDEMRLMNEDELVMPLFSDDQSAIDILKQVLKRNLRHYNLAFLMAQDYVNRNVLLQKVSSDWNLSDLMTKFCTHTQFYKHFNRFNLKSMKVELKNEV